MIVTEEEAKTKWCPFVRHYTEGNNRLDRGGMYDDHCIGSACMAWQYAEIPNGEGYCGLAGKP